MTCGAEDALCQALTAILHDNEFATTVFLKGIWPSWRFLSEHGDKLVGLLGIAFGFYKWWTYREKILHARFENYLLASDTRLFNGRSNVLDGLQRPGPGRALELPLFADASLCSVLREKNWGWSFTRLNVLSSAEKQLADAAGSIERRLAIAEAGLSSLRHQLATTHVLRGSIASASAIGKSTASDDRNATALDFFRAALQVPGQDRDPIAKELEAHQLRRLGDLRPALTAYRALEGLAGSINGHRAQRLLIARAKRRQAEILQVLASYVDAEGDRQFTGTLAAYRLLCTEKGTNVFAIRSPFGPFQGWELVEQGDVHYLAALVSKNLGFRDVAADQLSEAVTAYKSVSKSTTGSREFEKLCERAVDALERAQLAQNKDQYDIGWLLRS